MLEGWRNELVMMAFGKFAGLKKFTLVVAL